MKKLMAITFILLLMFSGSVIAASHQAASSKPDKTESAQLSGTVNPDGNTCWRCTSYAYYDGYRVCVSGYWSSNCPVYN